MSYFQNISINCYTRRSCNQNKLKLLILSGDDDLTYEVVRSVQQTGSSMNNMEYPTSMKNKRKSFKTSCLKGDVYVLVGVNNFSELVGTVEKYSFEQRMLNNGAVDIKVCTSTH